MPSKNNLFMLILVFFLTLGVFELSAWNGNDHVLMVQEARRYLPLEMRLIFDNTNKYDSQWKTGAVKPDRVLHDYRNHVWHVRANKKGRHYGGAPKKIAAEVDKIVQLFAANADPRVIAEEMALAAHYIADINNPLHTDTDPLEKKIHSKFERNFEKYGDKRWNFDGYDFHSQIAAWVKDTARRSRRYYKKILDAYLEGEGFPQIKSIAHDCYEEGTNDIIDLFYNIYLRCGSQLYRYSQLTTNGYKVNINQANPDELSQIYHINQRLARRIVRYREKHRRFKDLDEILKVKGMSRKRFNKIKFLLTTERG